ncbi:hypothetical protein [Actinokineospora inagensis]|uniref:hypothetical protein n=1 Tax=Actinokineospora inagensis TaxID=103730 RepID=UPI00041974AE|nr:hypothetical protein [Actinokineospora inagensis]
MPESRSYLRDDPDLPNLADLLGHLPLAVGQAAAHISLRPGMTAGDYHPEVTVTEFNLLYWQKRAET